MEAMETAKIVLSGLIETVGENGVTEGQAAAELIKHGFSYYDAIDSLKSVCKEVGAERTPEHTGKVICYRKPKPEKKEMKSEEMARKSAHRAVNERAAAEIINHYRR